MSKSVIATLQMSLLAVFWWKRGGWIGRRHCPITAVFYSGNRFQSNRPRFHQKTASNDIGNVAITDFDMRPRIKKADGAKKKKIFFFFPNRTSSTKALRLKKKTPDKVFFHSEIHATDSTCTGCSANIAYEPGAGIARRRRMQTNNSAEKKCNRILTKW